MSHTEPNNETKKPRIKSVAQWIWAFTAIIGIAVLVPSILKTQRMLTCGGWPVADGVVVQSDLKRGLMREGALKYQINIVYDFNVDGKAYQGKCISFTGHAKGYSSIQSLLATYRQGRNVTVHYAPSNPAVAVLQTQISWRGFRPLAFGLLLSSLGLAGLWRRWSMQTDYLFKAPDPDQPVPKWKIVLGSLGMVALLGLFWLWWELIKMYAGR